MTLISAPAQLCQVLSKYAVENARKDIANRGWRSSGALQPYYAQGEVGISATMKHLLYQNAGVKPFLMYWAEGRRLPLGCKMGDGPHLRTARGVGQPGYVDIPHRGRVWRNQKWRYPGLEPKRFIETAITKAINDNHDYIKREVVAAITGKGKEDAQWL